MDDAVDITDVIAENKRVEKSSLFLWPKNKTSWWRRLSWTEYLSTRRNSQLNFRSFLHLSHQVKFIADGRRKITLLRGHLGASFDWVEIFRSSQCESFFFEICE